MLRFSGQKIDDPTLMTFSARFGELDRVPIPAAGLDRKNSGVSAEAIDWVAVISSVKQNGKAVGSLASYELVWHTDMSYNPLPAAREACSSALEVPPDGGNTGFLNMYSAYETLSDELKRGDRGQEPVSTMPAATRRANCATASRPRTTSPRRPAQCIPSSACIP